MPISKLTDNETNIIDTVKFFILGKLVSLPKIGIRASCPFTRFFCFLFQAFDNHSVSNGESPVALNAGNVHVTIEKLLLFASMAIVSLIR